jgi:hypothetical protein
MTTTPIKASKMTPTKASETPPQDLAAKLKERLASAKLKTNLEFRREQNPDHILIEAVGMISAVLAIPPRAAPDGWAWSSTDGLAWSRPHLLLAVADLVKSATGQLVIGYQNAIGEAAIARLTEWAEKNGCLIERRPDPVRGKPYQVDRQGFFDETGDYFNYATGWDSETEEPATPMAAADVVAPSS